MYRGKTKASARVQAERVQAARANDTAVFYESVAAGDVVIYTTFSLTNNVRFSKALIVSLTHPFLADDQHVSSNMHKRRVFISVRVAIKSDSVKIERASAKRVLGGNSDDVTTLHANKLEHEKK
jgi:hypothetical protein